LTNAAFETFFLHRVLTRLTSRFGEVVFDTREYGFAHPVDWLSGAAMFVRRETVDLVGLMDESFFLFAEEIDWFKRMRDAGVEVWFLSDAESFHRDSDGGVSAELAGQNAYARGQYWRKHAGPLKALVAWWLLVTYMALRVFVWWVVRLRGGDFANHQYDAYKRGLSDMLAGRSLQSEGGEA